MTNLLQRILPTVQKPARYTGGGIQPGGQALGAGGRADCLLLSRHIRAWHVQPGHADLYGVMNEMEGVWCQRVFAPWGDMEAAMEAHRLPLWALESQDPVRDFDMIAFTIGYEMSLFQRGEYAPPIPGSHLQPGPAGAEEFGVCRWRLRLQSGASGRLCGLLLPGGGEESTVEIVSLYQKAKREDWTKDRFLEAVSHIPGYISLLYTHTYHPDGTLAAIPPGSAQGGNQANCGGSGPGLLPHQNHRTHHRNCPRPEQPGGVPGVHPGLPVLSGRLLLPPGAEEKSGGAVPAGCGEPCRFRQPRADPGQSVHLRLPGTEGAH